MSGPRASQPLRHEQAGTPLKFEEPRIPGVCRPAFHRSELHRGLKWSRISSRESGSIGLVPLAAERRVESWRYWNLLAPKQVLYRHCLTTDPLSRSISSM